MVAVAVFSTNDVNFLFISKIYFYLNIVYQSPLCVPFPVVELSCFARKKKRTTLLSECTLLKGARGCIYVYCKHRKVTKVIL
jgi:hypothetical protein